MLEMGGQNGQNKRNLLRPSNSKTPNFIVGGLLVVICIIGINYWSLSGKVREQEDAILSLEERLRLLMLKKSDLEKKHDALIYKARGNEDDLDKTKQTSLQKEKELAELSQIVKTKQEEMQQIKQEHEKNTADLRICQEAKLEQDSRISNQEDRVVQLQSDLNQTHEELENTKKQKEEIMKQVENLKARLGEVVAAQQEHKAEGQQPPAHNGEQEINEGHHFQGGQAQRPLGGVQVGPGLPQEQERQPLQDEQGQPQNIGQNEKKIFHPIIGGDAVQAAANSRAQTADAVQHDRALLVDLTTSSTQQPPLENDQMKIPGVHEEQEEAAKDLQKQQESLAQLPNPQVPNKPTYHGGLNPDALVTESAVLLSEQKAPDERNEHEKEEEEQDQDHGVLADPAQQNDRDNIPVDDAHGKDMQDRDQPSDDENPVDSDDFVENQEDVPNLSDRNDRPLRQNNAIPRN